MESWRQCDLPVITTLALWQLMHLHTWCTVMTIIYLYISYLPPVIIHLLLFINHFNNKITLTSFTQTKVKPFYCTKFFIAPVKSFFLVKEMQECTTEFSRSMFLGTFLLALHFSYTISGIYPSNFDVCYMAQKTESYNWVSKLSFRIYIFLFVCLFLFLPIF